MALTARQVSVGATSWRPRSADTCAAGWVVADLGVCIPAERGRTSVRRITTALARQPQGHDVKRGRREAEPCRGTHVTQWAYTAPAVTRWPCARGTVRSGPRSLHADAVAQSPATQSQPLMHTIGDCQREDRPGMDRWTMESRHGVDFRALRWMQSEACACQNRVTPIRRCDAAHAS